MAVLSVHLTIWWC